MSGIAGPCDCPLGSKHAIKCPNYIEVDLPCPVCAGEYGRHVTHCPIK